MLTFSSVVFHIPEDFVAKSSVAVAAAADTPYWLADIAHQGVAAFNPNPSSERCLLASRECLPRPLLQLKIWHSRRLWFQSLQQPTSVLKYLFLLACANAQLLEIPAVDAIVSSAMLPLMSDVC
jgi:hypothetical protein